MFITAANHNFIVISTAFVLMIIKVTPITIKGFFSPVKTILIALLNHFV